MNSIEKFFNSPKRIPLSYRDPKIFCKFTGVCITLGCKTARNCRICLEHERTGSRNKHKEFLEGMYPE